MIDKNVKVIPRRYCWCNHTNQFGLSFQLVKGSLWKYIVEKNARVELWWNNWLGILFLRPHFSCLCGRDAKLERDLVRSNSSTSVKRTNHP